jgi:DNA-binding XRE family transcriptional regulator
MNSKEALKDLREVKGWNDDEFNKRLDIIEKALKQAEKDKNILRLLKKIIAERNKIWK